MTPTNTLKHPWEEQPPSYELPVKPTQTQPEGQSRNATVYPSHQIIDIQAIDEIETYRCWSVFNILCCCLCLGLVACLYSTNTDKYKAQRNIQAAKKASKNTLRMNICATICGIIILFSYIVHEVMLYQKGHI